MKKMLKGFFLGVIVTTLLMSTALGAGVKKTIEVAFNSVDLTVNGKKVQADTIVYEGTTYVPFRAVGEMLDKQVGWDSKTNTVNISDKLSKEIQKSKAEEVVNKSNITNANELKSYLQTNYGTLKTIMGDTKFEIKIMENDRSFLPEDYWIMVDYEYDFFNGAIGSNKYTSQEKENLKKQLKDHMEELGKAAIDLMPNKKIQGGYYKSWYEYPNIRTGLITRRYYSWNNYGEYDLLNSMDAYDQTKSSGFRWYDLIDDKL